MKRVLAFGLCLSALMALSGCGTVATGALVFLLATDKDDDPSDQSDTIPPAQITDLSASTGTAAGTIDISWTASGDDGTSGVAYAYIVKVSTSGPITSGNFASGASQICGETGPHGILS